ncbi:MAG: VWA domain-containing protein [Chloroflexota bacterium]
MAHVKKFCLRLLVILAMSLVATGVVAQSEPDIRITDIDLSAFPTVGVRLLTRDARSAPITDLSGLVLHENRAPIPDFDLGRVAVGTDIVLVLDANDTFLQVDDDDGLTRRDKVAATVEQYARQFMDPTGLDRVTVVTPDASGSGVDILAEDVSTPQALAGIVADYQPVEPPRITPLNDMLVAALDHLAAQQDDGRFQAVLLFTDGGRLDQQLAYQDLALAAQEAGVPIFGAILGATADPNEVASLERLASPTRGQVVHLSEPAAADDIFQLFQSQAQQTEARYQSLVRRGGEVDVSAALGNTRTTGSFTLELVQPVLTLDIPDTTLRRVGSAIDSPSHCCNRLFIH